MYLIPLLYITKRNPGSLLWSRGYFFLAIRRTRWAISTRRMQNAADKFDVSRVRYINIEKISSSRWLRLPCGDWLRGYHFSSQGCRRQAALFQRTQSRGVKWWRQSALPSFPVRGTARSPARSPRGPLPYR